MAILDLINNLSTKEVALANYFSEERVVFLNAENKWEALEDMAKNFSPDFHKAIVEREKIVSTGIGLGVAIPHARLESYGDFFITVGVQQGKGLEWDSVDNSLVKIIFMVGGPEKSTEYLKILSRLTIAIKKEELRRQILRLKTPLEVIKLFEDF